MAQATTIASHRLLSTGVHCLLRPWYLQQDGSVDLGMEKQHVETKMGGNLLGVQGLSVR